MINLDKKPNPPFQMIKRKQGKMTNLAKNTIPQFHMIQPNENELQITKSKGNKEK
jgi:hypothetical protein